ncbi:MAG: YfhO family protein [Lachnospiraceae bacterium]|nr:YfhO family protein [Lachnospiraceae bacterium]
MNIGSTISLGAMRAGQTAYMSAYNGGPETIPISIRFYRLNLTALEEAITRLSAQHLEHVEYDSTHVQGDLHLTEAGRLILSVPYDKGWQIRINGERVKPELFGGALMSFDLEPGVYALEMHYVPYGKWAGIGVSLGCIAILGALQYRSHKEKKRSV